MIPVLLVDDDADMLDLMQMAFSESGGRGGRLGLRCGRGKNGKIRDLCHVDRFDEVRWMQ